MIGRRGLLGAAGAAGAGLVVGAAGGVAVARATQPEPPRERVLRQTYSPHGVHQSGITTPVPPAHRFMSLRLREGVGVPALGRLMRMWSGDISALMAGSPAPGDTTPQMARPGVSLTITVGFGPRVFSLPGLARARPAGFVDIPPMVHDRLSPAWTGGDLGVLISADEATTVAYSARRLVRDAQTFATLAWAQDGSWRGVDATGGPVTGRNLFGQLDGTANPTGPDLDAAVWTADPPEWFAGGTQLVVRRIGMDLDVWDTLVRSRQELVMGRTLDTGAPLTGGDEFTPLDLAATRDGTPVIPANAHARLAHASHNDGRRLLRRAVNYTQDELVDGQLVHSAGLLFMSFQASIADQFVPIQRTLDNSDALNEWTHAVGSAVFAVPGGFAADSWLGEALLG